MSFTTGIRFTGLNKVMIVLGAAPSTSDVTIDDDTLRVRMGRGRWLVNGSIRGLVRIDLDPPAPGRVCGFPVKVRELIVSVVEPDGLVAAVDR